MGIQRWEIGYAGEFNTQPEMSLCVDGDYVSFTDHEHVVAELTRLSDGLSNALEDVSKELVRLRAELAAKSKDSERMRGELLLVIEWATTENKALRPQEVASIQRALGEGNE